MQRISPTIVRIDLEALRFNFHQLKKNLPAFTSVLCVVKSNAYGHGAASVAKALQEEGADFFGVGTIDEGIGLRESGIQRPILILLGLIDGHFQSLLRYRLTPVLYDLETAWRLNRFLAQRRKKLAIHIKVDTGMTRLGVLPRDFPEFCSRIKKMSRLEPAGLLSHLADAGEEAFTDLQTETFDRLKGEFKDSFAGAVFHLANSQAVIDGRAECLARFGIALYGAYPLARDDRKISLKPVLTWMTQIVLVKQVPPGTPVSYGRTYTTRGKAVIGVLPVGYADGYPRILSNRSHVLVRGRRVPVVGTICMDMMMIDLTAIPDVKKGEEAVLIGRQGRTEIRAGELAAGAQTISYEIFCRIAERIPRVCRP